jgi:hypothetical protein
MWALSACHHASLPVAPPARVVEVTALEHYLEGKVAAQRGDTVTCAHAARWLLLLDSGPWTGLHAAELLVAANRPPTEAVERVLATVDELPPCEGAQVLDALATLAPDPRVTEARAARSCP